MNKQINPKTDSVELTTPTIEGEGVSVIPKLEDRITEELVFAVVGPVGSGCTKTVESLSKILKRDYGYEVFHRKLSDIIKEGTKLKGLDSDAQLSGAKRVAHLQKTGNELRRVFGNGYLAAKAIEAIAEQRDREGFKQAADGTPVTIRLRRLHIIDSLKHPDELKLLRETYGDIFWLFGVFAPEAVRRGRLVHQQGYSPQDLNEIIFHDYKEDEEYGQDVRDTFFQADFFVRNDQPNDDNLNNTLGRFIEILFGYPVCTPTLDEASMYAAHAEAARSACLSRQVGAVITSSAGEIIGLGRNDVPKFKGGLYGIEDGIDDHRCYKWEGKRCHNDAKKHKLYEDIAKELCEIEEFAEADKPKILAALKRTDIRGLIEYSRAVHAEMEAIISVARSNKHGLVQSTMYSTTYPCHSCARHILASGISRVIYIEPYPKSLATELHRDAISESETDEGAKLVFLQYSGVAPKNVLRLFKSHHPRKNAEGKLVDFNKETAQPTVRVSLDDYSTHERLVVAKLARDEEKANETPQPRLI